MFLRLILIFSLLILPCFAQFRPAFSKSYYALDAKKQREVFISTFLLAFNKAFSKVEAELFFVKSYFARANEHFFRHDKSFLRLLEIRSKYRIKRLYDLSEYEAKIEPTPVSLGIAQAIVESATGTSRFARKANNFFGEWSWDGQGLIPNNRDKNANHRIRIFDTLQASVDSYVLNLNRHVAYREFRKAREAYLAKGEQITGLEALKYLHAYSELGKMYLKIIKNVIITEDLSRFDERYLKSKRKLIKPHNYYFMINKI